MSTLPAFFGFLNAIDSFWSVTGVIALLFVALLLACFLIFIGEIIHRRRAIRIQDSRHT